MMQAKAERTKYRSSTHGSWTMEQAIKPKTVGIDVGARGLVSGLVRVIRVIGYTAPSTARGTA